MKIEMALWVFILTTIFASLGFSDLPQRVSEELNTTQAYPCVSKECPSQQDIEKFQYIYVDGFLGDRLGHDYNPMMKVLRDHFKIKDSVLLRPDSAKSISHNAQVVYEKILSLKTKSPGKKIIIFSHSKGGAESLLMSLLHPELYTSGTISDLIILNGAFNGTPLAYLWRDFCAKKVTDTTLCSTLKEWQGGLNSLKPNRVVPVMSNAFQSLSSDERDFLSEHIWAVQSQWGPLRAEWSSPLWVPHLYLKALFGPNDGVILTENEKLPTGFGKNLGVFNIDHLSLLGNSKFAKVQNRNESFSRALVREMVFVRR